MTAGEGITPRELVILKLLADKRSPKEIAGLLGIRESTAKQQVANVVAKLNARDASQAVAKAITEGIIGPLAGRPR